MNTPQVPNNESSKRAGIPRWTVPYYWAVGLLFVHNVIPWGISLLAHRYGWIEGRPGTGNLFSLILILPGIACIIWTMLLHFVQTPQRVQFELAPGYLLIRGPYKFSRNPMFLGELVLWLGWALFYGSVAVFIGFLFLWVMIDFIAVPREERELEARLGEAYLQYKRAVPRWFGKARR